jgi:hypothetical protein
MVLSAGLEAIVVAVAAVVPLALNLNQLPMPSLEEELVFVRRPPGRHLQRVLRVITTATTPAMEQELLVL